MSTNSAIEWTKHTFNPWWGCTKVHGGCAFCYAESLDNRWGGNHWGKDAPRRMVLGEWSKPHKWNAEAAKAGRVDPVFCASMCDLFEDFDGPLLDQMDRPVPMRDQVGNWTVPLLRQRVCRIIEETPNLLWLLLTKRPENVVGMVPWHGVRFPANVMVGTSPCDQATANKSVPALIRVPAKRFLSCEPLLGPVDLFDVDGPISVAMQRDNPKTLLYPADVIDWVIVGCESRGPLAGRNASDYETHARSIIEQCRAASIPVFHKQMPIAGRKSTNMAEWPEDLRVREFPNPGA